MTAYNQLNAYKETNIKTAGQGRLIIMLYDGAINNLKKATELFPNGHHEFDLINQSIVKAQDIITELMVSLDFDKGDKIAKSLFSLYMYFNDQLMDANMNKNGEALQNVLDMMIELRAAWSEIANQNISKHLSEPIGISISR